MRLLALLNSLRKKLETYFLQVLTFVSLTITYLVGIGFTSIIGRLVGKKFLAVHNTSSWQSAQYDTDLDRQF